MKKLLFAALALVAALTLAACRPGNASPSVTPASVSAASYQTITPEDVKKLMDSGAVATIVDVRTIGEYNAAHLKGAINIPLELIGDKKPAQLPDQGARIIVYCQTGVRAAMAAKELAALGYTQVYDMGGISSWPYETVAAAASAPSETSPSPSWAAASSDAKAGILSKFTAADLKGAPVDASVWSGHKLTMVNIWATFCGPCIQEMPELGKLNTQYRDSGFQVVGIVIDTADENGQALPDMVAAAKEIVAKTGADYEHILPSADLNKLILYTVSAVPTTIFVDENGSQVGEQYVGSKTGDDWAKIIDQLLKEVK